MNMGISGASGQLDFAEFAETSRAHAQMFINMKIWFFCGPCSVHNSEQAIHVRQL